MINVWGIGVFFLSQSQLLKKNGKFTLYHSLLWSGGIQVWCCDLDKENIWTVGWNHPSDKAIPSEK